MSNKKYVLAIDQGTTSSRAVLFDHNGDIAAIAQHEFAQIFPQNGWVEHDPMEILFSQTLAIGDACRAAQATADNIVCAGITNQRETVVLWDKQTGKPVYNAIVWQCRRTADFCAALAEAGHADMIAAKTGLLPDAYFSASKIRWILQNVPEAQRLADSGSLAFGTIDSWLIWNLTGGKRHVTDYTNASRTMLSNINTLTWDEELCGLFGVPLSILPQVLPCSSDFGEIEDVRGLEGLAGIAITGVAGDQHAALFGQCCFEKGQAKNTYGTGCFMLMNVGASRVESKNRLLSTIAWGIGDSVTYALEGSVFNAGSVIKWLRDDLRMVDSAQECDQLAGLVPDSAGMYIVPAFTGLGAPYWDMYARGSIFGLTRACSRNHFARAVLEAIAYQVKDLAVAMESDSGTPLLTLRADGGASRSELLLGFQADLLGVAIDRPQNIESTALGAAFFAGLQCGFWHDEAELTALRRPQALFSPSSAGIASASEKYKGWLNAVKSAMEYSKQSTER